MPALDWQGCWPDSPALDPFGFLTTLWVTLAGIMLASLLALFFMLCGFPGTFRDSDRQRLGIAVSQYAAAGTTAVLVFRRTERVAAGSA